MNERASKAVTPRVLVAYATREGHTHKISEHLAATLRGRAIEVDVVDVAMRSRGPDLSGYAHVVLAASVHLGKHEREMVDFVRAHRAALEAMPTSFLSVSMSEAVAEDPSRSLKRRTQAIANVKMAIDRFLGETGLHPRDVMPVAGALKYREYGWLIRFVMKRISKAEEGPTDTSRDYELTDWVSVEQLAESIASSLKSSGPLESSAKEAAH